MPSSLYKPTDRHELSTFFADARTQPVRNIMSLIPVTERPAIVAATSTYPVAPALAVAATVPGIWEFPKGDYILSSASQVLITTSGVEWRGQPGARLLLKDGGISNPIVAQDATDLVFDGLTILDQRIVDPKTGSGLTFINCSRVTVRACWIDGFTLYGVAVHDNNTTPFLTASTISYSGNTISDSANGLGIFAADINIGVSGSLYNNHIYNVVSVDPGGASMVVVENLITEAAGESRSYAESNTISFDAATKRISAPLPIFLNFKEGDQAEITGAANAGNNQIVTIDSVDVDGDGFDVLETIINEAAGSTVTVTKLGLSRIQIMDMQACDDITIEDCHISNIGRIGIEIFPKVASRNLIVRGNVVYECGKRITGGCGIKATQGYINAKVTHNTVAHCQIAIIASLWDTTDVSYNNILNCAKHGIAMGTSNHIRYERAPFNVLKVHNNLVAYCEDFVTGIQYTSSFTYPAINLNGLGRTTGLIDIAYNDIYDWPAGIYSQYILATHPNFRVRYNVLVDSGSSLFLPVIATANTTNGSPTLTNILIDGVNTTGGFSIGSELHVPGFPANIYVRDIDAVAKEITVGTADGVSTVNATATASNVAIYSAYLDKAQIVGNTWVNTDILGDQILTITATSGTFTLAGNGNTTAAIAENAAAATVETAILGLGGNYADAVVSGAAGGPYTIVTDAIVPLLPNSTGLSGGAASAVITRPDAANLTVQVYSANGRILNNILDGMGAYSLTVAGDGTTLMGNRWFRPNPQLTANRGVVNLAKSGTYRLHDNYADVSDGTQALDFMVNNTNPTTVYITNTYASEEWVRPLLNATPVAATGIVGQFAKNRITYGAAAPTDLTKNRFQGDIHYNTAPTTAKAIALWHCTVSGSTGQIWRAAGSGTGTTAQRPALVAFDAGYTYYDTSMLKLFEWTGTVWHDMTGVRTIFVGTAAATLANSTAQTTIIPTGVGSLALPADFFAIGSAVKVHLQGAIGDTGTPTLRLRAKLGTTVIVDTVLMTMPALPAAMRWDCDITYVGRSTGSIAGGGTVEGSLAFRFASATMGAEYIFNMIPVLTPFNTLVTTTVDVSAQWGTANALNTLTVDMIEVQNIT